MRFPICDTTSLDAGFQEIAGGVNAGAKVAWEFPVSGATADGTIDLASAVVDYRALRAYAPLIYLASCGGLVAVLLVGQTINGAHSWIVIGGGFQGQPSEFAKVALVVA